MSRPLQRPARFSLSERGDVRLDDPAYLRGEQYRDGVNLSARVELHRRFSTNRTGWFRWVFERLALADQADVLEIGCGTGALWLENRNRIPAGWRVVLSDLSAGMLGETRGRLRDAGLTPRCCVADAQSLPFADASFDAVIANHMLYHVPNRPRAFGEIRRVLRPGGVLLAATNGRAHLRELDDLIEWYAPTAERDDATARFGLENGAAQLQPWFAEVVREDYPDALAVTEVEPVVAYVLSTPHASVLDATRIEALRDELETIITREGSVRVTKAAGLFRCRAVR